MSCLELLTADQMQAVDRRAVELGVNSYQLMQSAGRAVAVEIQNYLSEHSSEAPVSILMLVGPGNNGGDALVAATILKKAGIAVHVLLACGQPKQGSDAAQALAEWEGQVHLTDSGDGLLHEASLIVDALFGAGFSRALSGDLKTLVETVNALSKPVISVDVPSGLDGSTGGFDGACIKADVTITFFRYKIAHYLYPGRALCGQLVLAQIGLSEMHLNSSDAYCQRNLPEMFVSKLPVPAVTGHKFTRGHVLVRGGSMDSSGAARLSANTALYCGAGLVTLACDSEALPVNAAHLTAVMMQRCDTLRQWKRTLEDPRINVVLIGPGNGLNESTRRATLAALASNRHCVVDADSLSCWQSQQATMLQALKGAGTWPVLTPHGGEFDRLFGKEEGGEDKLASQCKLNRARRAARLSQSVVVFKGPDTVIAAPDGRTAINTNAPPWLATAGSGDVLGGCIVSLLAQGMPAFEAACAGVWFHAEAAQTLGNPLCSEDLVSQIGREMSRLSAT